MGHTVGKRKIPGEKFCELLLHWRLLTFFTVITGQCPSALPMSPAPFPLAMLLFCRAKPKLDMRQLYHLLLKLG